MRRANLVFMSCLLTVGCLMNSGCTGTPTLLHSVQLTPSKPQTIGQGHTVNITALVLNDTANAGVTWTLTPATGSGTLTGTTTTAATYNAPASVTAATSVTVMATSITYPTMFSSLSITVEPPPSITTTTLPSGSIGGAYSATVNESGGVPPFTWSITSGSLPAGLSLGSSNTSSVPISGTPTAQGSSPFTIQVTDSTAASASASLTITISNLTITTTSPLPGGTVSAAYSEQFEASGGTAPYSWAVASGSTLPAGLTLSSTGLLSGTPTMAATSTFSITVTDSENPPASVSGSFSLTINGLKGNYAFEFSGFDSKGNFTVTAGSFATDGNGKITSGVEDFNAINGKPKNQTFTGTYTLGSDNRGQLVFTSLTGSPTYAFAIDSQGVHGRLIEFDASGIRGSGELIQQTVSTCSSSTISGEYVMGLTGYAAASAGVSSAGPIAAAGRFTATPPKTEGGQGSLGTGEMDANTPGFVTFSPSLSGTFQTNTNNAFCTATVTPQSLSSLTFHVYPVSTTEAFLVETDTVGSSAPYLTAGRIIQQTGYPFQQGPAALTGTSVAGVTGQFLPTGGTTYLPDVYVVSMTAAGNGNFTMLVTENQAGSAGSFGNPVGATYTIDQFGRVTTDLVVPFAPFFYIVNSNPTTDAPVQAVMVGTLTNDPTFGYFEKQSMGTGTSFSAKTVKGTFVQGTSVPSTSAVQDLSGVISFDGVSAVTGTEDQSTNSANTPGQTVTGTYALTPTGPTDGSGTYTLTSPAKFDGAFFIVSPTKIVMITTTPGDVNPVLILLGN